MVTGARNGGNAINRFNKVQMIWGEDGGKPDLDYILAQRYLVNDL